MIGGACLAAELALRYVGIPLTRLANATLFATASSFGLPLYGFIVARALPSPAQALALLLPPLVSASIGWTVYGERLGTFDLAGAASIAAALVLIRRQPAQAASIQPALAPQTSSGSGTHQ